VDFRLDEALPILRRTPAVLRALLRDAPDSWSRGTEGAGTWSPFDVVGHLIHADRTNWIPRVEHMLRHADAAPFPVFDRDAMFEQFRGRSLPELLDTFESVRAGALDRLTELGVTDADLSRPGLHPDLGPVTLGQHLATWVAHDFDHLGQVVRVMAKQYSEAVGPWRQYLSILKERTKQG
jgi:DinB family protein